MSEFAAVVTLEPLRKKFGEVIIKLEKFLLDVKTDLGFKDDVENLYNELKWMQAFLLDAEDKPDSGNNNLFQSLVSAAEHLGTECDSFAYEIFFLAFERRKTSYMGGLSLNCCVFYQTGFRPTLELNVQIKKLLSDIHGLSSKQVCYENENLIEVRQRAPYVNNEHMIGQDDSIKCLTTELSNGDSEQFVMYIVGMGGLGKTTLARKLYISTEKYFTSRVWICVSKERSTQDILMSLINSMTTPSLDDGEVLTTIDSMKAYLQKSLSDRCFLVVIDDLWDEKAWEILEGAFPKNNNGSKVIITTRNEQVDVSNNVYIHKLRNLNEAESWKLFCSKALAHGTECPPHLEEIGKEMVAKCSGLPLALEILGGILFTKSLTLSEWKAVRDNIRKELNKNSVHINKSDSNGSHKLRGKNKIKMPDIGSMSSGGNSYVRNPDINSTISAVESLRIKLAKVLPKLSNFLRDAEDDFDIEVDIVTLEKELELMQKGLEDAEVKPSKYIDLLKESVSEISQFYVDCEVVVDQIISLTQDKSKTDQMGIADKVRDKINKLLSKSGDIIWKSPVIIPNSAVRTQRKCEILKELNRSPEHMIGDSLFTKIMNKDFGQYDISFSPMGGLGKTTLPYKIYLIEDL